MVVTHVVLSIGSNIDREKNIQYAVRTLRDWYPELDISPVYETSAVGFDGPSFFNLIVGFQTDQPLQEITRALKDIEVRAGRVRGPKKFDSRVLDIDVVLYGNEDHRARGINVPRDEIEKYAFVLKPLADVYPKLLHPVIGQSFHDMWQSFEMKSQTLFIAEMSFDEVASDSEVGK